MDLYPDNTQSSFKFNLPRRLHLRNKYEVGLAEIQYPVTWLTFSSYDQHKFIIEHEGEQTQYYLALANFKDIEELIASMKLKSDSYVSMKRLRRREINWDYNSTTNTVSHRIGQGFKVHLSEECADVLGYSSTVLTDSGSANRSSQITRGRYSFFIYTNVVDPQIVGDVYAPLLRTVAIRGERGQIVTETFDQPHYVPVSTSELSTIEVQIKDDSGEDILFKSGKVICKLHFRQRSI